MLTFHSNTTRNRFVKVSSNGLIKLTVLSLVIASLMAVNILLPVIAARSDSTTVLTPVIYPTSENTCVASSLGNSISSENEMGRQPTDVATNESESNTHIEHRATVTDTQPVYTADTKMVNEKELLEFTILATDPDGDPLIYSASNLPSGAAFDAETGTFSWTPRNDQAGTYSNVHFEVSDGEFTDAEDVTITVVKLYEDWDVNGDGTASVLDMILVGQHWGETGLTGWIREDANEDGTVNVLDMIVVGQYWTG